MNSEDQKILQEFLKWDMAIRKEKFDVIKNTYPLENYADWQKFSERMTKLNNRYQELKACLPNVHPEYGEQDNAPFLKNMMAVIGETPVQENYDYKKLKSSIRILTIFQEYDNFVKQAEYYSKEIKRQTTANEQDILGNPVVISSEVQEKFQEAITQQKRLFPKYQEAQEFLFGSQKQEQEDTKTI